MDERLTTTVAGGFLLPEGPRWHEGALWFVDMLRGNVHRLADGTVDTVGHFDHPTAIGFLPEGDLLVIDGNLSTLHTMRDGSIVASLDLSAQAHHLNDMIIDRRGWVYVDAYGSDSFNSGWEPDGTILMIKPDGRAQVVADNILGPNGIAISPDGRTLVVGESMGPGGKPSGARLLSYEIADDGTLSNQRTVGTIERGSGDGLCIDSEGAIWVGVAFGHEVQRFVGGEVVDRIVLADRKWALACALGGPDLRTMFICSTAPPARGDVTAFTDGWIETIEVDVPGVAEG